MASVYNENPDSLIHISQEVGKICHPFLDPRKLSYFQFKRVCKDGLSVILANRPDFFNDIMEKDFAEPYSWMPFRIQQSTVYFWDESLSEARLSLTEVKEGIYHGLTIISRRKDFYDCTTFAMSQRHASPFAYYCHMLKDLQMFAELFPTMASSIIEKLRKKTIKPLPVSQGVICKNFFLPKRSSRFSLGRGINGYITTYEAICAQLFQEGKSYKEIGCILSMAPSTVETHLKRFRARTGLTLKELSLQSFQDPDGGIFNLKRTNGFPNSCKEKLKKQKME